MSQSYAPIDATAVMEVTRVLHLGWVVLIFFWGGDIGLEGDVWCYWILGRVMLDLVAWGLVGTSGYC